MLDAFLLRAMAVAGWAPALAECARCGAPGPHRAFSVPAGGAVCADCRPAGSATPAETSSTLMVALLSGDWDTADASPPEARREASGLVAAHLQWHLERGLRSLPLVDAMMQPVTYDSRMVRAATAAGLPVASPGSAAA